MSAVSAELTWPVRLITWYHQCRRQLPWREQPTPYRVWISEIMLQQTQIDTVRPYFDRFLQRFPDVAALAAADQQDVLKLWEGLGYYARARNLHAAAREIVARHRARMPVTAKALRQLPGFGPYTAAAVASIAFGEAVPAVDGNVLRVIARFRGLRSDISLPATKREMEDWLRPHIATVDPGAFTQALMELGALICRPRNPACPTCPLRAACVAFEQGLTAELPIKKGRQRTPHYDVGVAVIWRGDRFLLGQRPLAGMLGGLWELPGGKCRHGESPVAAIRRRVPAETGLTIGVGEMLGVVEHAYTHFRISLHAFNCTAGSGVATPLVHDELRWVTLPEAAALPLPKTTSAITNATTRSTSRGGRRL